MQPNVTRLSVYLAAVALAGPTAAMERPDTAKRPVTDTYHGTTVVDDYRWLEDWELAEVKAWSESQNQYARSVLDHLPGVEKIRHRVTEIMTAKTARFYDVKYSGGHWLAMKNVPPLQQPFLLVADSPDADAEQRVLVDPNIIDASGATSIEWYKPSHDGKLVAVCLSIGGREVGDVKVYDVATGNELDDFVPRVHTGTAGGDLAWAADNRGFYYTGHPREGEREEVDMNFYQQVYFHELGTPTADDRYEIGNDFPRIAETRVEVDATTGRVIATVQFGDGGEFAHYLRDTNGNWQQFSEFGDRIIQAEFGKHDDIYIISRRCPPWQVAAIQRQ